MGMFGESTRYEKIPVDGGFRFHCIRCNLCCGTGPNVTLTVFDVVRISEYLNVHWRTFLYEYAKVIVGDMMVFIALRDKGNGECVFMEYEDGLTRCKIYPARPMRCRLYPLYLVSPSANYLHLDRECPGVGRGEYVRVPRKLVERYSFEVKYHYREIMKLVLDEGMTPLEALEAVLERLWDEAEKGAEWARIEYLSRLGST